MLFGKMKNAPVPSIATHMAITAQPCQQTGGPQPHPYFLAGNQYLGLFVSIAAGF
jgi:hypothetical protein